VIDAGGGADKINIGGANHDDLWFWRAGDDLQFGIRNTLDWMSVEDWQTNPEKVVEQFTSVDDSMRLLENQVQQLVAAMAVFDPSVQGDLNVLETLVDDASQAIAAACQSV
jgi:hypothetical protein